MSVDSMISRLERIADAVPSARSEAELRSLGSQAMGTALAIKEELDRYGISTDSAAMRRSLEELDRYYGNNMSEMRRRVHIALQQIAGYYRALLSNL
jgi:hypothetical protein